MDKQTNSFRIKYRNAQKRFYSNINEHGQNMNLVNKGALFDAPKDKDYKYSGVLTLVGSDYQLFVYEAESKKGQPYLQISAYPKRDLNGHTA